MANNLNFNPWLLDTTSSTAVVTYDLVIQKLRVSSMTATSGLFQVTDQYNNVIWEGVAGAASYTEESDFNHMRTGQGYLAHGLKLTSLSSGKLFVYHE